MSKDRKPITILRISILSNGEEINFEVDRHPRMTDEDMMLIIERVYSKLKDKYGTTKQN